MAVITAPHIRDFEYDKKPHYKMVRRIGNYFDFGWTFIIPDPRRIPYYAEIIHGIFVDIGCAKFWWITSNGTIYEYIR